MFNMKALGSNVLVQVQHIKESDLIQMADESKRVNRFSKIISKGPDVKNFKIGDEVLIPGKEGRTLFPSEGREFAVFDESAIQIARESF